VERGYKRCVKSQSSAVGDYVAAGSSVSEPTIFAQIQIDLAIGLEQGSFVVGNTVRLAVGPDYFLDLAKFVYGHGGEQVMLDLAAEAAGAVVDSGAPFNIAAGEHLLAQEICGGGALQQRHALMIGREYQGQIEPEEHLLRDEEQEGMRPTEEKTEQAQEPTRVKDEETPFDSGMRDAIAQQESDAVIFQHERFEQRQRKETEMLVSDGEAREPALAGGLVFGESEQRNIDVGVGGDVVRRAVMAVMLVEPPTEAEPEQQIRMNQANGFIRAGLIEDFLVAGIVNDKTELGEDEGEESGVAKLDPRIVKFIDQEESGGEQDQI